MKQICVILAHPYEKSLNAAIANAAVEKLQNSGYEVKFHDLYKEKFNPILSGAELISDKSNDELLKAHQKDIANAHGIVIIHPNWWGEPPAILKGWIDRVLRQRVAYDFAPDDNGGGLLIGLLKAKAAVSFQHLQHPRGQRKRDIRRSAGKNLEKLHFRFLRRENL